MYVSNCCTCNQNNGHGNQASLNILLVLHQCNLFAISMWFMGSLQWRRLSGQQQLFNQHFFLNQFFEDSVWKCCRAWLGESNIRGIRQHSWHDFVSDCGLIITIPDPPCPQWLIPLDLGLLSVHIAAPRHRVIPSCKKADQKCFPAVRYFYPPTRLCLNHSAYWCINTTPPNLLCNWQSVAGHFTKPGQDTNFHYASLFFGAAGSYGTLTPTGKWAREPAENWSVVMCWNSRFCFFSL